MPTYLIDNHLNHFTAVALICALLALVCLLKRYVELQQAAEERARLREAIDRVQQLSRPSLDLPDAAPAKPSRRTRLGLWLAVSGLACAAVGNALAVPTHLLDGPYGVILALSSIVQGMCGVLVVFAPSRRALTLTSCGVAIALGSWLIAQTFGSDGPVSDEGLAHLGAGALAIFAGVGASALTWRRVPAARS
jgi:hypothetical protein